MRRTGQRLQEDDHPYIGRVVLEEPGRVRRDCLCVVHVRAHDPERHAEQAQLDPAQRGERGQVCIQAVSGAPRSWGCVSTKQKESAWRTHLDVAQPEGLRGLLHNLLEVHPLPRVNAEPNTCQI